MALSWDDFEKLKRGTVDVCWKVEYIQVDGRRFSKDIYDPPVDMGFPAQIYTVMPALHGGSVTGNKVHLHTPNFMVVINLN